MSADVLKPYTNEKLPHQVYESRCGEIFITRPLNTIVLRCVLCETMLHTCEDFRTHIFAHYLIEPEEEEVSEVTEEVEETYDDLETFSEHTPVSESEDEQVKSQSESAAKQKDELLEPMVDINTLRKAPSLDVLSEGSLAVAGNSTKRIPLPKLKNREKYKKKDKERNLQCKTCGASFTKKNHLMAHTLRHTGEKPFPCDDCKKAFYTRSELMAHKRHHSGERPYICTYCGARFTTSGWRLRHEKGHELRESNNRPFQCEQCDKAFFDAPQLRAHAIVHTRERNHVCDICSAAFMRRKNLLQHKKIHDDVREYVCNVCDKQFSVKTAMQLHQRKKHGVVDEKDAALSD